jgi:ArsR family transcriptional regulator
MISTRQNLSGPLLKVYENRVNILKAMAHPTRLFILEQLKNESLCVCEINDMIEADVSTISKHLLVLKNAGLVSSQKRGLQVFYRLETPCVLNSLNCIEEVNRK